MRHRLPTLNALRAFEAAGRCGSLTGAANELRVSVAAISRHVALLEAHFGRPLLRRHRTGVEPTVEGATYLREVGRAFDLIDGASRALAEAKSRDRLNLRFYTTFTTEWLAPRLPAFRDLHRDVELDFSLSTRDADLRGDTFDLALTAVRPTSPDLHVDRLFEMVVTLVCAPEVGASVTGVDDLSKQTLLFSRREIPMWDSLLETLGMPALGACRRLEFDALSLTFQAARNGGGVALGNVFFLADDLRENKMVAPLDVCMRFEVPHYLVCHTARMNDPAVAAFRSWILSETAVTNALVDTFLAERAIQDGVLAIGSSGDA